MREYRLDGPRAEWALALAFGVIAAAILARPYLPMAWHYGPIAALRHIADIETYNRTVIASNYFNDGFVRRGLGGTIISAVTSGWRASTLLFIAISAVALIVPLALLVRRLAARIGFSAAAWMAAVLALSAQTFFGWSRDLARTDMLVGGCLALMVLAWLGNRRWLAVGLLLVGLLVHETAVILGLPLLAAMAWQDVASGRMAWRQVLVLALQTFAAIAAILLLQSLLSAPASIIAANMLREAPALAGEPEYRLWRDIAIYMAAAEGDALRTALCYNLELNPRYLPHVLAALLILAVYAIVLPLDRKPLLAALVMWVPVIFLVLVANDTGRWLKLGVLNGWLLAAFLLLRGAIGGEPRRWRMAVGLAIVLALLAMGATRHNQINRVYERALTRIGVAEQIDLQAWMDHCDPDWQRYVYGDPDARNASGDRGQAQDQLRRLP